MILRNAKLNLDDSINDLICFFFFGFLEEKFTNTKLLQSRSTRKNKSSDVGIRTLRVYTFQMLFLPSCLDSTWNLEISAVYRLVFLSMLRPGWPKRIGCGFLRDILTQNRIELEIHQVTKLVSLQKSALLRGNEWKLRKLIRSI